MFITSSHCVFGSADTLPLAQTDNHTRLAGLYSEFRQSILVTYTDYFESCTSILSLTEW